MFHPLGNVGRGSHINILLVVLLVSLADMHLRMRCFAVLTTRIPATKALTTVSTTAVNNTSQELQSTPANNSLETPPDDGSYRLPTSVLPFHYFVELEPFIDYTDPAKSTFRGHVAISIRCEKATNKIILHKEILSVDHSSVIFRSGPLWVPRTPNVTSVEEDPKRHFIIFTLDKHLEVGKIYMIDIYYTSPLTKDPFGLYYSNSSRGNTTVYTVASHLEPVYARRVFPCFDEPAMKAKFTVGIRRTVDRISLSNMPIAYTNTTSNGRELTYVRDVFQISPNMSTYQLAFVVCDFLHLSKKTKSNVTYNTWAKPSDVNKTRYALDVVVKVHEFFEDYFDIKYPLPKQDLIAVDNFAYGAMENWGLIIFRDNVMLYEQGVSTVGYWRYVTTITAHEIAHMWIGNLVTLEWWNEVWIKEGFTAYFEFLAVENVTDDWKMFDYFFVIKKQYAFRFDHAADSRPLYVEVLKSEEIKTLVTYLFYSKGPVVARMLNFVVGDSTFQKAFRKLLKKRQYGTFVQQDLYNEMTQQAKADGLDIDVKEFMDTWVLQGNFPVVTVTQDVRNEGQLHVAQQRFLQDPTDKDTGKYISPFNYHWNIPLTFASSKHIVFNQTGKDVYWLKKDEPAKTISVKFPLPKCTSPDGWILANVQGYGFYRVNYHIGNWLALSRQLKRNHLVFPTSNRAELISDAFSLYKANYIPLDTALTTLEYLHREREYLPWEVAQDEFATIGQKLALTPLYKPFETFMRRQLTPAFAEFSLRNISYNINIRTLHSILASRACQYRVKLCLDQAREMYGTVMIRDGESYVHPDVKSSIYCYGVATGNLSEWQFAFQMYNKTTDCEVKGTMIAAMACATRPHILKRYLGLLLDEFTFSKEDAPQVLNNVIHRPEGRTIAWGFFVENYKSLRDKYNQTFECSAVLPRLAIYFNRQEELENVVTFWTSQCDGYNQNDFEKAVKNPIKKNIEWLDKYSPIITAWLNKNNIQT